uniref:Uncharacterized protein n=1 Tax=Parascaris univalens TaxID=6257 RepID=A0A915B8Y0_PARUN
MLLRLADRPHVSANRPTFSALSFASGHVATTSPDTIHYASTLQKSIILSRAACLNESVVS